MSLQSRRSLYWLAQPAHWLGLVGLLALTAAWLVRPSLAGHGLRAEYSSGVTQLERVAFVSANKAGLRPDKDLTARWTGYLFQPAPGVVVFRVPQGVHARLTLNGQAVFDTDAPGATLADRAAVQLPAGFQPVELVIKTPLGLDHYYQAGLEWQTAVGWRLVPAVYLYPGASDTAAAERAVTRRHVSLALAGLTLLAGLAWLVGQAWVGRKALATPTTLGLVLLVALALALRLLILRDLRSVPNPDFIHLGTDHRGYQDTALNVLRGTWPQGPFRVQPGISYFLAAVYAVFGPHLVAAQMVQMLIGSLATLLVFSVARQLFGRAAGWAAAGLWAIFPLPIFYEAQVLTHGLEGPAGALLLWLWFGARRTQQWRWLVPLGLELGVVATLRPTFLALAPVVAISLVWRRPFRWRAAAVRSAILALAVVLPIAPVTWWNYHATGDFQLLSAQSEVTLYLGNNLDSTGLGEDTPAYRATHTRVNHGETTYLRQTLVEIRDAPVRWLQLMVRKLALYLGNPELPNNVDFYIEGTARSPLLAALPLRFGAMMALALAGAALALASPLRRDARLWIVLAYAATHTVVMVTFDVFSRLRAPQYPVLAILGGGALAEVIARLRRGARREAAVGLAALAAGGGLVALMPFTAEHVMSRPVVRALPEGSRRLDAPIGETLTLVGYDALPATQPGEPVFVTLYWQATGPLPADLFGTVQVFAAGEQKLKLAQADQALGTGSFPDYPTQDWQPGQIVWDRYLLDLPGESPTPQALTVLAAAYDRATGERLGETAFGPLPLTYSRPLDLPPDALPVGAKVGDETLAGYRVESDPATLSLTLYWQAGGPTAQDQVVFVHLFNAAGEFVLGQDARPMNGLYGTQAWQPGEGVVDEHRLELPADLPPGQYRIEVGMYDAVTQVRQPVFDANGQRVPDNSLVLSQVER